MPQLRSILVSCAAMMVAGGAARAFASTPCDQLTAVRLEGGSVTSAELVKAGDFSPPGGFGNGPSAANAKTLYAALPEFCRVTAHIAPSTDSSINFEVWMPVSGWNGKLVENGNGAFTGAPTYTAMAESLEKGYAATSSDTGHTGNTADFAVGHPEKIIDLGYRAIHVNAVAAKAIVQAHYGFLKDAYFVGCSTGGRQAYGEAQRYPTDFNGIVAGAPGINFTHQTAAELAIVKQIHMNPSLEIDETKLKVLHSAVIAACDAADGVKDGVIENPLNCHFNPETLVCKEGEAPNCLTAAQAKLANQIYDGVRDSKGNLIFAGLPRGTELIWGNTLMRTNPMEYGVDAYRDVVLQDPTWDFTTLNLDTDIPAADKKVGGIMNNYDPNLKPYFTAGGKLLGYQGWSDGMNSPLNHIGYYESVAKMMGGSSKISSSYRLFLVPGMAHCGGGEGTATFDLLGELDTWVNTGKAPDSIAAARTTKDGHVDRTRPLCPYPQQAIYKGTGSTDEAANFVCGVKK